MRRMYTAQIAAPKTWITVTVTVADRETTQEYHIEITAADANASDDAALRELAIAPGSNAASHGRPLQSMLPSLRMNSQRSSDVRCSASQEENASRSNWPDATSMTIDSCSSTSALISQPFSIRKTSIAAWPTRLFPSTNG